MYVPHRLCLRKSAGMKAGKAGAPECHLPVTLPDCTLCRTEQYLLGLIQHLEPIRNTNVHWPSRVARVVQEDSWSCLDVDGRCALGNHVSIMGSMGCCTFRNFS